MANPTMMPPEEPSQPSYSGDQDAIWREITAIWQVLRSKKPRDGLMLCTVQPEEPSEKAIGLLWYDTDEEA